MITSILEFFALGTLGFWGLCVLVSIVFVACLENDNRWFPTIITIALAGLYWKSMVAFALGWKAILLFSLVYLLAGVAWSFFRWIRYVKEQADVWRKENGNTLKEYDLAMLKRKLDVSNNKGRLTGWIAYWPWSLVWNITGDFFTMVYENLQGAYQKIADRALGKFTVGDNR
jgi:hypothetical protein